MFSSRTTQAERPSKFLLNPIVWLMHYPTWPLFWLSTFSTAVWLVANGIVGYWVAVLLLGSATMNYRYWQSAFQRMRAGNLEPAVVLSLRPTRIATLSDLSMGSETYPHIKVSSHRWSGTRESRLQVGTKLVMNCSYAAPLICGTKWADFYPLPLQTGSADARKIKTAFTRISPNEWERLDFAIDQLPKSYTDGLYEVDLSDLTIPRTRAVETSTTQAETSAGTPAVVKARARRSLAPAMRTAAMVLGLGSCLILIFGIKLAFPRTALETADRLAAENKFDEAYSSYELEIRRQPKNAKAYWHRAAAMQAAGRHEKAHSDLNVLLRLKPDFGPGYRLRAISARTQGLVRNAEEDDSIADRLGAPKRISRPLELDLGW